MKRQIFLCILLTLFALSCSTKDNELPKPNKPADSEQTGKDNNNVNTEESEKEEETPLVTAEVFNIFINDAVGSVWMSKSYDLHFTNGEVWQDVKTAGGTHVHNMMLFSDGTARYFIFPCDPDIPTSYKEWQWSAEPEKLTITIYDPELEEYAETDEFTGYSARTTLELISYKEGDFVMQGVQPGSIGVLPSQGLYIDYATIHGRICKEGDIVEEYLSYGEYTVENEKQ